MELRLIEPRQMVVTQANELATAAYSMTLLEKRLVLLVASAIRQDDEYMKRYSFPAVEVMHFLGLHNNHEGYSRLRSITRDLLSRVVDLDRDGDGDYEQFQWMASARYVSRKKSTTGVAQLELQVHSQMRPFLLELRERFSSVPFGEIAQLPSFHSMRIFEILWAESHQLRRERVRLPLDELKRILKVEKNYPNFNDFRRFVLDKAKRDLDDKTPLTFTYETETQGRKVLALVFTVRPNEKATQLHLHLPHRLSVAELSPEPETPRGPPMPQKTLARLQAFGMREPQAREFIATYGAEYVEANLDVVEERQKKGEVKNLMAYVYKALAQDYRKQGSEEDRKSKSRRESQEQANKQLKNLEARYERERQAVIASIRETVPLEAVLDDFRPYMETLSATNGVIAKSWRNDGETVEGVEGNPVLRGFLHQFILDSYALPYLRSFEAWKERGEGTP